LVDEWIEADVCRPLLAYVHDGGERVAEYEISNPLTNELSLWTGPSVIFDKIGSLGAGEKGRGDFIYTYQSKLETDGQTKALANDQWVHVTELDGVPVDGWISITHLGRSKASVARLTTNDLVVTFGVELQGYSLITLTGTLTPK
jgi:hypothetical protein